MKNSVNTTKYTIIITGEIISEKALSYMARKYIIGTIIIIINGKNSIFLYLSLITNPVNATGGIYLDRFANCLEGE